MKNKFLPRHIPCQVEHEIWFFGPHHLLSYYETCALRHFPIKLAGSVTALWGRKTLNVRSLYPTTEKRSLFQRHITPKGLEIDKYFLTSLKIIYPFGFSSYYTFLLTKSYEISPSKINQVENSLTENGNVLLE